MNKLNRQEILLIVTILFLIISLYFGYNNFKYQIQRINILEAQNEMLLKALDNQNRIVLEYNRRSEVTK